MLHFSANRTNPKNFYQCWSFFPPSKGTFWKMTIEGIPEPSFEGDSFPARDQFLFPSSETSVTFSVAAAPMPSDCGTYVNRIRVCGEQGLNLSDKY